MTTSSRRRRRPREIVFSRRQALSETVANPRNRLFGIVLAGGVLGGLIGAAYLAALDLLQRVLWPTETSLLAHGVILVGIGVTVGVLGRVLGSSGDVELLVDNIHVSGGSDDLGKLPSLLPISLLCIAAGGAMGPEAPLVQTTGTVGSWCAIRFGLAPGEVRVVTITGMAAGFTVLFGAPLGAAVFALEILHRRGLEYYEALMPAVLGSLAGYAVYVVITGVGLAPVWTFAAVDTIHVRDLGWAALCGLAGAGVAAAFTYLTTGLRWLASRATPIVLPALGGLALALLAWMSPYALTFGEAQLADLTTTNMAVRALCVAAAAKLLGTTVTLATGWKGGFIIPLFFIGAALGQAGHLLVPSTNATVLIAAMMVACNVGVTKTPLGSVLVVTEMAGISLLPTTLLASAIALVLTSNVGLIHSQRRRSASTRPAVEGASG